MSLLSHQFRHGAAGDGWRVEHQATAHSGRFGLAERLARGRLARLDRVFPIGHGSEREHSPLLPVGFAPLAVEEPNVLRIASPEDQVIVGLEAKHLQVRSFATDVVRQLVGSIKDARTRIGHMRSCRRPAFTATG